MIRPLSNYVVVSKPQEEEKIAGSILYKPQTSETQIVQAEVLAVGPGDTTNQGITIPMEVAVGDIVMFNRRSGTEIVNDGIAVLLMREDQLFCVVNK